MPLDPRDGGALVCGYLDNDTQDPAHAWDTVLVKGVDPYDSDLRSHRFGLLAACDITGGQPVEVEAKSRYSLSSARHVIGLLLSGAATFEQHGRKAELAAGQFVLYAAGRPFRLAFAGAYRYFVISVDQGAAALLHLDPAATANAEVPRHPTGRILAATMTELADAADHLSPVAKQEMGEHINHMLRTVLREWSRPAAPVGPKAVFDAILAYIERHLGEDLSPARLAATQHISVRYLHALFRREGDTVGDFVRRSRLAKASRDLADPTLAHLPAYTIGARWGMPDPSHFGKLFKAEFSFTPQEYRKAGQASR
jgi:AraC-like DNA-binding protein